MQHSQHMDALEPRGPQAEHIADWFYFSFYLAIACFVIFIGMVAWGLLRARRRDERGEPNDLAPRTGKRFVLWGGVVVPLVLVMVLLVLSAAMDRGITRLGRKGADPLTIEVTGHKFWWEVQYRDPLNPHREFTTANEIHVPVDRPVRLLLKSADVIHSFWVPNLHGKKDLVPGRTNDIIFQVDEPGILRGQCAEFCGIQHAKMAMLVVAHEEREFDQWWDHQVLPQEMPRDSSALRGHDVFMKNGCAMCHSIRGTEARGSVAPDLTHIGSRHMIAAATLPNTRGHLAGWIRDPQGIKPGNYMPPMPLGGEDLRALLDYLQGLK